ncbi:MAG: mRNA surveillance protein pelota [Candidatus Aenigmatarchaeota archaeon]
MRIIFQDQKEGVIKLAADSLDDLWHLSHILEPGDLVTARTLRKTAIKRGTEIELGEKRPITLTIRVDRTDFHMYTHKLRITGKIVSGPENIQISSFHTIDADPGITLKIQKKWKTYQLERLKKARIKKPFLFMCLIDREQADFASMKESGLQWLGSINFKKIKGKEDNRDDYYRKVMEKLESEEEYQHIIVAGPGFEKDNVLKFIKEENPELAAKIKTEYISYIGKNGAQELMKTSINRILKDSRVTEETLVVEELLKRIKQEKLVAYNKLDVERAIEMGAIETLIVSQEKLKELDELMEKAEKVASRIIIVSSDHESGEKFLGIGGIGALLRYEMRS